MERETVERSKEWTSTLLSILNEKHEVYYYYSIFLLNNRMDIN